MKAVGAEQVQRLTKIPAVESWPSWPAWSPDGSEIRTLWLAAIVIVVVGSLLPSNSAPVRALDELHVSDKLEHVGAYALLAFLPAIHEQRRFIIAAAIGAVLLGIGLEFGQLLTGWRDFEVGDMIADAVGVCSGVGAGIPIRSAGIVRSFRSTGDLRVRRSTSRP